MINLTKQEIEFLKTTLLFEKKELRSDTTQEIISNLMKKLKEYENIIYGQKR